MKKILFLVPALLLSVAVIAQDNASPLLNKRGRPILPEAKDWSIGVDANFIIDFAGNLFNNSTSNPGGRPGYLTPNTIIIKMMQTDKLAYIAMLRIGNWAIKENSPIYDQLSTSTPKFLTTDTWKRDSLNLLFGAGFQRFRGHGRLQGVYGATAQIGLSSKKDTYTYGNDIDENHPLNADTTSSDQNTTVFGTGIAGVNNVGSYGRLVESKSGTMFTIGLRGFIGVEYFFVTKMSLGAQFGWGISLSTKKEGEYTAESLDANSTKTTTVGKTKDKSVFAIDTDNAGGQISLNFYF